MNFDAAINLAIANVAHFGDTDVFPHPLDRFPCTDAPDKVVSIIQEIDRQFDQYLAIRPPENIDALVPLGYTAFRWATQIDPPWNLYFLSHVISIADVIEAKRLPISADAVYSYRFQPDSGTGRLFADSTWQDYKRSALEKSKSAKFVLIADIADFYPRVAHHRLENELIRLQLTPQQIRPIKVLISKFSNTRSYGLPVGGPASRILAELSLLPVDLYLDRKGISFCRYVDDFHIFATTRQEAYGHLAFLSQILFNEGLTLQRTKTRILTCEELRVASAHLDHANEVDMATLPPEARLMRISVKYDPYSPTAEEDYLELQDAVSSIDIVGLLGREIAKTNIDTQVVRQAIGAIRALPVGVRRGAIETLLDLNNLDTLAPVFTNVMRLLRSIYDEIEPDTKDHIDNVLTQLIEDDSHLIRNELNFAFLLRVFGQRHSARKETLIMKCYESYTSPLVRKDIILIMAKWGCTYWLSDLQRRYGSLSNWERKAFVVASFHMSDEGEHWQKHSKSMLTPTEALIREWYRERLKKTPEVPL